MTTKVALGEIVCPPPEDTLNESPVKWCSVSLSDVISRGKRLEASVFDVEAKQARLMLQNGRYPIRTIDNYASSYVKGRFKRIWVKKSDYPIYQPSAITDIYPRPDGYLSKKTRTDINALRVHEGQVLMTCSGTIGKVSYVSKTLDGQIFSHDLLRINCNNDYDAGYLYTFLKSKIGNKILLTNSYGAVITHIEPEHLASVPIPDAPPILKQEIHQLIMRSYDLRDESNALLDEAEALLKAELHLPELDELDVKLFDQTADVDTFNVKLHDMNGRLDASYHVPIVDAIVTHLEKYAAEVTTVGDERISNEVILPGRFKRIYVEEGYGCVFIGGKQISELDPSNKKYLSRAHHAGRIAKQLELNENMTLITCSGTIGKVALVPKHWEKWAASQHIIRVVPSTNEIAGYLYIFLASEYAAPLLKRYTYGAVVDEIDDRHVREIPFPILKNHATQKKINTLALQANEKRYEAYRLEQKALKLMDEKVIFAT